MSDIRDFIKVADAYGKEVSKQVNEGFGDWLAQKLGITPPQAAEIAQAAEAEAENQGVDPEKLDAVSPEVDSNAPAQPVAPTTDTAPTVSTQTSPGVGIDADQSPERPQEPTQDAAPQTDAAAPAQPAGNNPDEAPATTATPNRGRGDGNAEVDQRRRDRNAADDDTAMAQPVAPATTAAPTRPGQQTSGLPAKLAQIRSANLMKDYNAGGKQPMDKVKDVQLALSRLGHDPNGIDGKYGPGTFKAVQEFQKANGLTVDGQVGPNTIKKMIEKLGGAAPAAAAAPRQDNEITNAPAAQSGAGDEAAAQAAIAAAEADTDADSTRVEELIAKLDQQPAQQNASTDFSHLIAIVEGRILKEALSQADVQELQGLIVKHRNNTKFNRELLSRAEAAVAASGPQTMSAAPTPSTTPLKPLDQVKAPDNTVTPVSAAPTGGSGNPTPANANAGKPAAPAADAQADNAVRQGQTAPAAPEDEKNVVRDGSGKVVRSGDGTPVRTRSDNQIWWDQNMQGKPFPGDAQAQKAIDARKAQGDKNWNSIKNFFGGNKTQQNQSKDLSMKTAMNESASMNVSMTGDNAAEVAELMKLLKNAGMPDAGLVKDIMPPMAPKGDMADFMGMVDSGMQGPAEPCSVCGEVHEETSCSEDTSEYDAVVAEWDNSPDEEYKDANYMLNDLAGGLNRPKKAYAAAQDGDNAMAVEAIKADLRKALEEALAKK